MKLPWQDEKQQSPTSSLDNAPPLEYATHSAGNGYDDNLHVQCPPHTTERKLVTTIDFHVLPFLCILYLLAFLDRVNIANANVAGLSRELGLENHEYNVALVIFFVPYILFEIPSNILLKKFKPNVWLSLNMFFFGFATIMQVSNAVARDVGRVADRPRRALSRTILACSSPDSSLASSRPECSQDGT